MPLKLLAGRNKIKKIKNIYIEILCEHSLPSYLELVVHGVYCSVCCWGSCGMINSKLYTKRCGTVSTTDKMHWKPKNSQSD